MTEQQMNLCLICGDQARGINFNVMTCMSCKAFFRRNALRNNKEFHCQWENKCEIDKRRRSFCAACRLKKCLQLGMDSSLIRGTMSKTDSPSKRTTDEPATTVGQVSTDRSILTFDEWNILSNILQAYDEQIVQVKNFLSLKEQLTLPAKIRWKISTIFDYLNRFDEIIQPFLEQIPQFNNLDHDSKRILIRKNFNGLAAYNSIFLIHQFKLLTNEFCLIKCKEIYGHDFIEQILYLLANIDSNETLMKLFFVTLAFSGNCSLVEYDQRLDSIDYQSTIQNVFIVLLWKYLVYQYGFPEAIRRLNKLVKFYLDLLYRINEIQNEQHREMNKRILNKILRKFEFEI